MNENLFAASIIAELMRADYLTVAAKRESEAALEAVATSRNLQDALTLINV